MVNAKESYKNMTLDQLASVIRMDWVRMYFGAVPYLCAMESLDNIENKYGLDSGKSIVAYFLSNAQTWRGDTAREVKAELNRRLKD